jgi:hypothetical protein
MTDSEVLTMEIVGEIPGFDTDKDIFGFFRDLYGHYFPKLTSRVSFVRHAANLWKVKKRLFEYITESFRDVVTIIDSFPIPVCRFARVSLKRPWSFNDQCDRVEIRPGMVCRSYLC